MKKTAVLFPGQGTQAWGMGKELSLMSGPLNVPHAMVAMINTMLSSFLMLGSSRRLMKMN